MFLIGNFLFIFIARMADVSLMTIRMLMIVRGRRIQAALIGFVEVTIYIVALGRVVQNLDNTYSIIAYALGFSAGSYLGSFLEDKMAMGFLTVHVISKEYADDLIEKLRDAGFGVTVVNGMGRYRLRKLLYITVRRKDFSNLLKQIEQEDKEAFVTVMDTRAIKGGFLFNRKDK